MHFVAGVGLEVNSCASRRIILLSPLSHRKAAIQHRLLT